MNAPLSELLANGPVLLAVLLLFGGGISVSMLAFLVANAYFLPGPPAQWSLRGGVTAALLGTVLTGVAIPLIVIGDSGLLALDGHEPFWLLGGGVFVYLLGLSWLELRARPDAAW